MKSQKITMALLVFQIILVAVLFFQVRSIGEMLTTAPAQEPVVQPTPTPTPAQAPTPTVEVSGDDDPRKGAANAPVTIIEFGDFQCPFCARFYQQTLPQIEEAYIKTGKVKFIYRDFPLNFHPEAQKAAEAAECADEQGKFWEMHDIIFNNQGSISVENYKKWAADLGLDMVKFNTCLDTGAMADEVQSDYREGQTYGVSGTPGFFINEQKLSGAQPFEVFKQIIEAELAK